MAQCLQKTLLRPQAIRAACCMLLLLLCCGGQSVLEGPCVSSGDAHLLWPQARQDLTYSSWFSSFKNARCISAGCLLSMATDTMASQLGQP